MPLYNVKHFAEGKHKRGKKYKGNGEGKGKRAGTRRERDREQEGKERVGEGKEIDRGRGGQITHPHSTNITALTTAFLKLEVDLEGNLGP